MEMSGRAVTVAVEKAGNLRKHLRNCGRAANTAKILELVYMRHRCNLKIFPILSYSISPYFLEKLPICRPAAKVKVK